MSAVWLLALGASIGYLAFQKQLQTGRLEAAKKEWEADGETSSDPQPPGANRQDLLAAQRYTEDTKTKGFNPRLTQEDREFLKQGEEQIRREVQEFDSAGGEAPTAGLWLETGLPF